METKESAKHTPGPWEFKLDSAHTDMSIWAESVGGVRMEKNRHKIADIRGWGHLSYLQNAEEIQDSNGRLIAAAPELLEALESAKQFIEAVMGFSDGDLPYHVDESASEVLRLAQSAIDKAKGADSGN